MGNVPGRIGRVEQASASPWDGPALFSGGAASNGVQYRNSGLAERLNVAPRGSVIFPIIARDAAAHAAKRKLTCTICNLKKCVGRCHFERVRSPRPSKSA